MAKVKFDGVVEAVRYTPEGRLDWVRTYLRRGPIFSDYIILDRQTLIEQIKSGKKFMVGQRLPYLASTFDVSNPVRVIEKNGKEIVVAGEQQSERDHLEGAPLI